MMLNATKASGKMMRKAESMEAILSLLMQERGSSRIGTGNAGLPHKSQRHSLQLFVVALNTCLALELLLLPCNAQTAPNTPTLRVSDGDTSKEPISAV